VLLALAVIGLFVLAVFAYANVLLLGGAMSSP
jgi:hypothetical protein